MRKVEVICVWSSFKHKVYSITVLTHKTSVSMPVELVGCLRDSPTTIDDLHTRICAILKQNNFYVNHYEAFNSKFHDIYFVDVDSISRCPSRYGIS